MQSRHIRIWLALVAGVAAAIPARGDEDRAGAARLFRLTPAPFRAARERKTVALGGLLGVRSWKVRFPSAVRTRIERNNTVHSIYFEPRRRTDRAVVFLPWFKERNTEKIEWIGTSLALAGFKTLFIAMGYQFERAPRGHGSGSYITKGRSAAHLMEWTRQAVLDARRARLWLVRERGVHERKVGLFGISLGGFVSALTYGVAPEFRAAAVLLAGGNLGPLVRLGARLGIPQVVKALERMRVKPDDLPRLLRPYDPVTHADPTRKRGLLLVNGVFDPVVPYPLAHALWRAWGKPRMIRLPAGHVTSVVFAPYILMRVIAHLRRQLR